MPKASKAKLPSHRAATHYLRAVLPAHNTALSDSDNSQDDDWANVGEALTALEDPSTPHGYLDPLENCTSDTEEVQATPKQKREHCVRCHRTFDANDHNTGSCEIPHVFNEDCYMTGYYDGCSTMYRFDSSCCGEKIYVLEIGAETGDYEMVGDADDACITLKHTSNPRDVRYNDINVVECKIGPDGSCALQWLDLEEAGEEPMFESEVYQLYPT